MRPIKSRKTMKKILSENASKEVGRHSNYFMNVECVNKALFQRYLVLGKGNLARGYCKYESIVTSLRRALTKIFFKLKEKRKLSDFFRNSKLNKCYKNIHSFIRAFNSLIFTNNSQVCPLRSFETMKLIVKEYKKYKR